MPALLRAGGVERSGPPPEGAAVRTHQSREGNHAEDVKEVYFYLDDVPTHAYLKGLYKYHPAAGVPLPESVRDEKLQPRGAGSQSMS